MISMKNDPKPAEGTAEAPLMSDPPAYPWGLQIRLEDEQLAKLKVDGLPPVGAKVRIVAIAEVSAVSQNQEADGDVCRCVTLQITDMDPPAVQGGSAARKLYPSMPND